MNKCIYLKEDDAIQTFNKAEHIFPAGIGGIQKLPKGYVCDYVNGTIFSKMELGVMRESILAISRILMGPGKRGSLSEKKESRSKVSVLVTNNDEKSISLGYVKRGKPYQIPQISIKILEKGFEGNLIIDLESKNVNDAREDFLKKLARIDSQKYLEVRHMKDDTINKDEFVLGYFENKWYIITNGDNLDFNYVKNKINLVIDEYRKKVNINEVGKKEKVIANINLSVNINEFYRVCSKIAFNYLSYVKKQDFVLDSRFDKIRKFILGNTDIANVHIIEKVDLPIEFPDESHVIIIVRAQESLFSLVSFYNGYPTVAIELCEKIDGYIGEKGIVGYICDWKNRKEYKFMDYIEEYYNNELNVKDVLASSISNIKL